MLYAYYERGTRSKPGYLVILDVTGHMVEKRGVTGKAQARKLARELHAHINF